MWLLPGTSERSDLDWSLFKSAITPYGSVEAGRTYRVSRHGKVTLIDMQTIKQSCNVKTDLGCKVPQSTGVEER